ncbi:MAG TPA: GGDEF domain-containing phosphodiesterase, partial [Gemmatimonadales bacterium]
APIRGHAEHPGDILRAADSACYLAKRRGGKRVELHDPAVAPAVTRRDRDWARKVVAAIEEDRLQLHAQRVLSLHGADGRAPRLELLLRLDQGRGDPLLPGAFLPAARRHGLMPRVDHWVIGRALRYLAAWREAHPGLGPPTVSINLGDETVSGGDVEPVVREALASSAVPPSALCFEIGESVATTHAATSTRVVRELREAGCQVTLEHCGGGMAAFTLLRRMPVDYLKIAGHIVRGMARDPVDRVLATALNDVGHALGLGTIGTEVESADVLDALRGAGVDYAQGYRIRRPEPLDRALARLTAG